MTRELDQLSLVLRSRDPGHRPNLGETDLGQSEGIVDERQPAERVGHTYLLSGGTERDAAAPTEPMSAGERALTSPAFLLIENPDVGQ